MDSKSSAESLRFAVARSAPSICGSAALTRWRQSGASSPALRPGCAAAKGMTFAACADCAVVASRIACCTTLLLDM
jgi:hypothetical protein